MLLAAATALTGHSAVQQQSASLEQVLRVRLDESHAFTGESSPNADDDDQSLEELRLATAMHALHLLTRIQVFLEKEDQSANAAPLLGTRDTVVIQTLAALTCNWGANALLASLYGRWPSAIPSSSPIVDLTDSAIHLQRLVVLAKELLHLACPFEHDVQTAYTRISAELLTQRLTDVLRVGCTLGWADCLDEETRSMVHTKTRKILST